MGHEQLLSGIGFDHSNEVVSAPTINQEGLDSALQRRPGSSRFSRVTQVPDDLYTDRRLLRSNELSRTRQLEEQRVIRQTRAQVGGRGFGGPDILTEVMPMNSPPHPISHPHSVRRGGEAQIELKPTPS